MSLTLQTCGETCDCLLQLPISVKTVKFIVKFSGFENSKHALIEAKINKHLNQTGKILTRVPIDLVPDLLLEDFNKLDLIFRELLLGGWKSFDEDLIPIYDKMHFDFSKELFAKSFILLRLFDESNGEPENTVVKQIQQKLQKTKT